jgi:glycosyltransferase involved in cell wall biosynthesis
MDGSLAVVSHTFTPDLNGQAVVLGRLLRSTKDVVRICSDRKWRSEPCPAFSDIHVATPWILRKLRKFRFMESTVFEMHVQHRARGIANALFRYGCSSIVACTGGDLVDLPSAVLASKRIGIPCFLHYFDDYRSQWKIPNPAWSMRWMEQHVLAIESRVLEGASGVMVPNELLREDVSARVTAPIVIIRNPVELAHYDRLRKPESLANVRKAGALRITYTGSVYEAQLDAVIHCGLALEMLRDRGIEMQLHLYTSQSKDSLHARGVPKSVEIHPMVSLSESGRIQCESDLLLLPLAFQTRYPELIRTSAPGKLGEYLAAGRPILVHAPSDTFLARFAKERGFGIVCDQPEPRRIAEELEQLVRNPEKCKQLAERAIATSFDFSDVSNQERYLRFIWARSEAKAESHP